MTFLEITLKPDDIEDEHETWQNQLPSTVEGSEVAAIRVDTITAVIKNEDCSSTVHTKDNAYDSYDEYEKIMSLLKIVGAKTL